MRRLIACTVLCLAICDTAASAQTRVLFLGNSYTRYNDMPNLFKGLAEEAGHSVFVDHLAPGGYSLTQHSTNTTTLAKIAEGGWDRVFLQEQSTSPVIDFTRENEFYPAARTLDSLIVDSGSQTGFYMTWGRELGGQWCIGGHCSPNFPDYFAMQATLTDAYTAIAEETGALLIPVGVAWSMALQQDILLPLWSPDRSHPSLEGSYLTACVFFAFLFSESPEGLAFYGGLDPARALFYQQVAAGLLIPTAVENTSWGSIKARFK